MFDTPNRSSALVILVMGLMGSACTLVETSDAMSERARLDLVEAPHERATRLLFEAATGDPEPRRWESRPTLEQPAEPSDTSRAVVRIRGPKHGPTTQEHPERLIVGAMPTVAFAARTPRVPPIARAEPEPEPGRRRASIAQKAGILGCLDQATPMSFVSPFALGAADDHDRMIWQRVAETEAAGIIGVAGLDLYVGSDEPDEPVGPTPDPAIDACMADCFDAQRSLSHCMATCQPTPW